MSCRPLDVESFRNRARLPKGITRRKRAGYDESKKVSRTLLGLQSVIVRTFCGGTKLRSALRCPGWPPRFRPEGGVGGLRFKPMGSDEGGLEELVELSLSRASRSPTRCSNSAIRPLRESKTARMATWASGGTVFQSGSGMGG